MKLSVRIRIILYLVLLTDWQTLQQQSCTDFASFFTKKILTIRQSQILLQEKWLFHLLLHILLANLNIFVWTITCYLDRDCYHVRPTTCLPRHSANKLFEKYFYKLNTRCTADWKQFSSVKPFSRCPEECCWYATFKVIVINNSKSISKLQHRSFERSLLQQTTVFCFAHFSVWYWVPSTETALITTRAVMHQKLQFSFFSVLLLTQSTTKCCLKGWESGWNLMVQCWIGSKHAILNEMKWTTLCHLAILYLSIEK